MTRTKAPEFPLRADRVLVLCSHTDDELGCAGTILRLSAGGARIKYIAFSRCEESVPKGFPLDVLVHECEACTTALGIAEGDREILDYPVRHFPEHRQEILQKLIDTRAEYMPDLILVHSSMDIHQDHSTLYQEALRAFKHQTILGYELPQNMVSSENSAFVALSEDLVDRKISALREYKSQANRPYATAEFIRGLAKVRGVQCNAAFAEVFEAVRLILK